MVWCVSVCWSLWCFKGCRLQVAAGTGLLPASRECNQSIGTRNRWRGNQSPKIEFLSNKKETKEGAEPKGRWPKFPCSLFDKLNQPNLPLSVLTMNTSILFGTSFLIINFKTYLCALKKVSFFSDRVSMESIYNLCNNNVSIIYMCICDNVMHWMIERNQELNFFLCL